MITVYVPIGVAGCGKTTYFDDTYKALEVKRVSADAIRFKLLDYDHTGKDYDESIEPLVWTQVYDLYAELLKEKKYSIYFDCTNLTLKERSQIIIRGLKLNPTLQFHFLLFNVPLYLSLGWNHLRKRTVPEKVIAQQFSRFEQPQPYEYDLLTVIEYNQNQKKLMGKLGKTK
jgi:predicted kinase